MHVRARVSLRRLARHLSRMVGMAMALAVLGAAGGALFGAACGLLFWPLTGTAGAILVGAVRVGGAGAIAGALTGGFGTLFGGPPEDDKPDGYSGQPQERRQGVPSVRVWGVVQDEDEVFHGASTARPTPRK